MRGAKAIFVRAGRFREAKPARMSSGKAWCQGSDDLKVRPICWMGVWPNLLTRFVWLGPCGLAWPGLLDLAWPILSGLAYSVWPVMVELACSKGLLE